MKGNQFTDELSREIYEQTYRYGEETIETTQRRVAEDIASIEQDKEKWTNEFLNILEDFKFVPGGRIISNAGTKIRGTTYINCFTPETEVLTNSGYKKIIDVKVNDKVLTHTGKWRSVKSIIEREYVGEIDVYNSSVLTSKLKCTPEHPFYQGNGKWVESKNNKKLVILNYIEENKNEFDIDLVDYVKGIPGLSYDESFINTVHKFDFYNGAVVTKSSKQIKRKILLDEGLSYFFGRFVGDGSTFSVNKTNEVDGFNVIFSNKEFEELEYVKNVLENSFGIKVNVNKSKKFDGVYIRKNSIIISEFLRNSFGRRMIEKKIPDFIWKSNKNIIESFLLGLVDSDGMVTRRQEIRFSSANYKLLKDVQALFNMVGMPTRIRETTRKGHDSWILYLNKNIGELFLNKIRKHYDDDRLKIKKRINNGISPIIDNSNEKEKIHEIKYFEKYQEHYKGLVYNLSVDVDESYIVNNVVVHNCFVDGFVGKHQDSVGGILEALKRQAFILKSEGGYGFCADVMRPRGGYIEGIANDTPGAVKWLDNWNTQSDVITAGSGRKSGNKKAKQKIRKGAQMVTMSCWHPDIEEFITAKQTPGRLEKFNMSVLITDAFMNAVLNNEKWDLIFPDFDHAKDVYNDSWDGNLGKWIQSGYPIKVYKTFKDANELWDLIMKSTYNRNEPGVLFVDTMNRLNNLSYCEYISATNPCVVGDTLIAVADGRNAVSIKQLTEEGKDVPVYSTNNEGRLEIKWGRNPRLTGKNKEVWKLTMDDGSTFIATPDHRMYLKNNTYKELKDLQPGESLSSFYSFDSNKGYRQIAQIGQKMIGGRYRNRRQYRVIYEFFNGIGIDYKQFAIHHKDFDNKNDLIDNLELMPIEEHKHLHSDRIKGSANPYHRMSDEMKFAFASHPGEKNPKYSGISNDILLQKAKELYKREGKFTAAMWVEFAKEQGIPHTIHNDFRFKSFSNFKRQVVDNHKVVNVEFYGHKDVYNITVDDNHNYNVITSFDDDKYIRSGGICVKNCGEQILPIGGVCLLGNLNLTQFIKEDLSGWDYDKMKKIIPVAVRFMDNVNDLTYVPLEDQKENLKNKRRIGLGILGYGSALLIMKKRYGSPEALKLTEELMSFIANTAYQSSALLAAEKGSFLLYDEEKYLKSLYLKNLSDETRAMIKKYGIRNSHLLSIQPTGNSSILANVASGGLEPVFLFEYVRTVIQPFPPEGLHIPEHVDWSSLTFTQNGNQDWKWIKEGDENMLKTEYQGFVYKFDKGRGLLKESVVKDYGVRFLESIGQWDHNADWAANINNLKIEEHVDTMKVISKYIDSSMSKTINLPNDYKFEDFKHVYVELYKSGTIKGGTTYRAGTMATVIKKKEEEPLPVSENNAPKRPRVLECDVHRFMNKGEKWIGFIGMHWKYENSPYEIFTGLAESFVVPNWVEKGQIRKEKVKNKEGVLVSRYDFVYNDKEGYEVIMTGLNRAFQREYWNIGKMTSALLRHRMHLPSVIGIIESLNLDGDVMGTWKKGISRMLKKYVKTEDGGGMTCEHCGSTNLLFKENCISCLDCNWSKCE